MRPDAVPREHEFVVVGSGAGGATLARELTRRGRDVLVLERGRPPRQYGTLRTAMACFDRGWFPLSPRKSKEGVILWRALTPGGTTVVSCGNGTRCLEHELGRLGVNLVRELDEAERETDVQPWPPEALSAGTRAIRDAAADLGHPMEPMPKFVDPGRCTRCGRCVFGCAPTAKWTALDYLDEARRGGAEVLTGVTVEQVTATGGRASGVVGHGPDGRVEIAAGTVVLCAGGLGTPAILQRSGVEEAGRGLFADLFVNTYAVVPGAGRSREPAMSLVDLSFHESEGFLLSPFVNRSRLVRFVEAGTAGLLRPTTDLVGIMAKTADDRAGGVAADGAVSKPVTDADRARLRRGSAMAEEILTRAGARPGSVFVSRPQGAHPGGTAAIGEVVDPDLQTRIEGLFVCDASVLPTAPGSPPILTIVALAKRLAAFLTDSPRQA